MKMKLALPLSGILAFLLLFIGIPNADAYMHTATLKTGSRGSQVVELQKTLNANGYTVSFSGAGAPGMETSYFGIKTKTAVMSFQSAQGLVSDGIVGPITGTRLAALGTPVGPIPNLPLGCSSIIGYSPLTGVKCDSTTTTPPVTQPDLSGNNGVIHQFSELSPYSNEEVAEGQKDIRVAGFEIEASRDGDIEIQSVRLSFDPAGNTGSNRLDRYIDSVSLWMDDTRIATARVDDFSRGSGNVYSRTMSINKAIVRSGQEQKFYITVDAVRNLDSADISGDSWTVDVESVRYKDGLGVVTTDNRTGDMNSMDVPINFVTFSSAADTNLKISLASDNPEEGLVIVRDNRTTDGVLLLKGALKLEGTSDVTIEELPVTFTVSGTAANVDAVLNSATLIIGNEEYTERVSTTGTTATVIFDRLDYEMRAGRTVDFSIVAEMNRLRPGIFEEGDTIKAEISSANRDLIEVENERGDDLSNADEKSGTAIGKTMELRKSGIMLSLVSTNTSSVSGDSANDDIGTFRIKFKVKALGEDAYISSLGTTDGLTYLVDKAGEIVASGTTAIITNNTSSSLTPAGNYRINEGEEETVEVMIMIQLPDAGTAGLYRGSLTGLKWDTDDDATPDNNYTFNLDQFRTPYMILN